ncbi:CD276 antigen isoform X2 [Sardina pilchardus]|uniref:CD276 antigen isoform X2 n=1 Tax=Sardina pilchardus TaxID=27697 RepID=UPI002E10AC01
MCYMAGTYVILVVLLSILKTTEGKDAQVTCIISEHCILPCAMEHGDDVVIHWYHAKNNDNPVHSYYQGRDRLEYQDTKYSGRTYLFTDLISSGNASLSLTDVKIQDQGRYKCYTSTKKGNDEQFVNVEVEAALTSVDLTAVNDILTCKSEDIYPAPTLAWSTDPPSQIQPEKAPETQENAQGLFSISSSVQRTSNNTYTCTITAGQTTRTSSRKQQSLLAEGGEDLTIPCSVPEANLKDFTLTWLFNGDTKVLTFDSRTSSKVYDRWEGHVKYTDNQSVIKLLKMNDQTFSGKYSCEVVTTKSRYFEQTDVLVQPKGSEATIAAVTIVITLCIIGTIIGIVIYRKVKRPPGAPAELHELKKGDQPESK